MKAEVGKHVARSEELLRAAGELVRLGFPADSVSRSYYAMFHAAKAVLLDLGIERKSHHAVWAAFGQHVAAPGLVDRALHRVAILAFRARLRSDYLAEPEDTEADARDACASAEEFVAACRRFVEARSRKEEC